MRIKNPNFILGLIFILVVTGAAAQLVGTEPTIIPGRKYGYMDVLQIFLFMAVPFVFGLISPKGGTDDSGSVEEFSPADSAVPDHPAILAGDVLPPPYLACAVFNLEEVGALLGEHIAQIRDLPDVEYDACVMTVFSGDKLNQLRVELRQRPSAAEHKW